MELQDMDNTAGNHETKILLGRPSCKPESYDYILVGKKIDNEEAETFKKQKAFIEELKAKNFDVKVVCRENKDGDKLFYGIRAPEDIFEKYRYLLKVSDSCNGSRELQGDVLLSTRIRIVHFVLHNTFIKTGEKLSELMKRGVFETKFCLHEKNEQKTLTSKWARWTASFRRQPISDVRDYFGEKVALYYVWLGLYTTLLIPAATLGIIVFLYGMAFFETSPLIKEVCEADTIMCPLCDKKCKVWQLSDTCTYAKVSHLFDNEGTVAFAMFMAVWATVFLELWRRQRAVHVSGWNVSEWDEDEEELILGMVNDPRYSPKKYEQSCLRSTVVLILVTLMLMLIIGLAQALVIFRVAATGLLSEGSSQFMKDNANTFAVIMGAVLHYLTIIIMTKVNRRVALLLCKIEKTRSFVTTERSFTVKMFTFQFFTLFSSLFYVAFFLGRINGYPGKYSRISGKWRLEECHPTGCLTDLFIQMAIVMVLKQIINNIFEFIVPWISGVLKNKQTKELSDGALHCKKDCSRMEKGPCDNCKLIDWLSNYNLKDVNVFSVFNEFIEMIIQFSFTTIFVAAFPLAPLLALFNNVIEIRLDAIKMVSLERRLIANKTNNIGMWDRVLEVIGVLAVIANGLVIGITSDFIPRLVYRYHYGPCATGEATDVHCMTGYINHSLSTAYMSNEAVRRDFEPHQLVTYNGLIITHCRYKDYRNDVNYELTSQFWLVLGARFAFVILFEHIVLIFKFIAAWLLPDCPLQVKNSRLEDKFSRLREELVSFSNKGSVLTSKHSIWAVIAYFRASPCVSCW
ncbi:anoctamin-9-like isoform X1 [Scleropages formosus]|uniref:anoctamin-9-like isoform X1 n=1 Tax=Scleropages formosus TaxID=113540 RepID=UPI0010FA83C8|nr:anoctamin-9-like isoform X1 [Scleropages formosus]XP_018618732.2 anoctamin-9-like isoform X1 [Scleropages formosus]